MTGKEVESAGQAQAAAGGRRLDRPAGAGANPAAAQAQPRFDAHADEVAHITAYVRLRQGQAGIR